MKAKKQERSFYPFTFLPFYLFTLKRLAKLHILFNTCKDIPHKQEKNTTFAREIFINARI